MLLCGEAAAASPNAGENSKPYSSSPITLTFMDVSFRVKLHENNTKTRTSRIKNMFCSSSPSASSDVENPATHRLQERPILNSITGTAAPGKILAILGPSGSGKSTLLNALAGRLRRKHGLTGKILYNNRKLTKSIQKNTGFVAQDDVLHPHLTVRETLVFCSLLRLPISSPRNEKISVVESFISELGLSECADTIVGDISGGERKRVSIAHEMLVDPSLVILDEPTSGLDATAAYRVVAALGELAAKGKTVVTSVHQPSSRVYQVFDELLVLSEGRCIYFGGRSEAMEYFESVGFSPCFLMNPADFLLDLANGINHLDGTSEKEKKPNVRQALIYSYNILLAPKVKQACLEASSIIPEETTLLGNAATKNYGSANIFSTWFNQFTILLRRNLKARRQETFNSLRVFQVIMASLLAGFMWWHSDHRDIQDRLGLLFFISIFWGVLPSFNAAFAFPQDRAILIKEMESGMYTLSPYFMARITGDLPMELILPTFFLCITYWMTGLRPEPSAFATTLVIVLGYVLVSQGLGLALGALIMDAKKASTVVTVTMLAFVLTGGYYVHRVPFFVSWMKYVSTTFYCYQLLISIQYGDGESVSSLLGCSPGGRDGGACKFVYEDIQAQIHPAVSVGILLIMFLGYRLLAYVALSRVRA